MRDEVTCRDCIHFHRNVNYDACYEDDISVPRIRQRVDPFDTPCLLFEERPALPRKRK